MRNKSNVYLTKENKQNSQQPQFRGGVTKVMKKKLAAFVLSSSMVLSLAVPAFAAATNSDPTKEPGKYLQEIGVIKGDQNGDLLEGSNWKRQDVTVLLSTLLKQKEEAKATANTHGFTDVRGTNYNGFISWAKEKGYMVGESATKFGFDSEISYHDFAAIVLRALDYKVAYADVPTAAVEAKILPQGTDFTAKATRGNSYAVIVAALNTVIPGTGQTLGNKLGLPGFEVTDPAVTSVEALNLKQVKVTFNKEVDKASAETLGNYKVYNNGGSTDLVTSAGSVALQSDKKSVIVTLGGQLNNGQNAKVAVENVKDSAKAIAKYENDAVPVSDTTVPTVVGVSISGPRTLTVEFSEPVQPATPIATDFVVDNGNYIVVSAVAKGNKVEITVGVDLTVGEHTIKVGGGANGTLADYAGYKPVVTTKTFSFVKDETAPVATVKSVSPTSVTISFSKPVKNLKDGNVVYRHTYNNGLYSYSGSAAQVTTNAADGIDSATEVKIDFKDRPIPLGANNVYIDYTSSTGTQITDLWGNKLAAVAIPVSVSMDTVKPTVKEVKFVDAQTLKLILSEEIDAGSITTFSNYVVKDSAGKAISVTGAVLGGSDKNEITLSFAEDALGGGSYTIEVKGLKDKALVANIMDTFTTTLAVTDTVKPYVLASNYAVDTANNKTTINIPFSEQMNTTTLVKTNFLKKVGSGFVALGSEDTVTAAADGKSVKIVISGHSASLDIRVGAVTDLAGNGLTFLGATSENGTGNSKTDGNFVLSQDAVAVEKVEAIGTKQIKVIFNGRLSSVTATGFSFVTKGAGTPVYNNALSVASHTVNGDNKSEVVFNLANDLTKDVKVNANSIQLVVGTTATDTKSFLGTQVTGLAASTAPSAGDLIDKLAPGISKAEVKTATTIEITFEEALNNLTFAATLNGFSVSGGDAKLTSVAVKANSDNKVVVLTGENFQAGVTAIAYNDTAGITDLVGNKLASFTDKKAEAVPAN